MDETDAAAAARRTDPGSANGPELGAPAAIAGIETPASQEDYHEGGAGAAASFVRTMDSRNVLIEGLHFVGSPMWTIHLLYSDNVTCAT